MKKHFVGVGEGFGVAMSLDPVSHQVGVLRSFELEGRPRHPILQLKDGIYEVPGRVVLEIPARTYINEKWLRTTLLDADYDSAPERTHFPENSS